MIYKHRHFTLDDVLKKVFDENEKELCLTGNAFRVLAFLCKHESANISEIGDELDRAKDYDEDHIRQYRYKINTIIGAEIVKYENKIYRIDGTIKKIEKKSLPILSTPDRNTDLLRSFFYNNKMKFVFAITIILVAFTSIQIFWFKPWCNIKGNISITGEKIYHIAGGAYYNKTKISELKGERWFCSEVTAIESGWRKSKK